ncbi:rhodanese-like domain-containing protein, partial [Kaarinaea lacus]
VALPGRSMSPLQLAQVVADKFTPVVFFCDGIHSSHSYRAAKKVVALGYANVFWFRGGIQEWADKGLPIVALHK